MRPVDFAVAIADKFPQVHTAEMRKLGKQKIIKPEPVESRCYLKLKLFGHRLCRGRRMKFEACILTIFPKFA